MFSLWLSNQTMRTWEECHMETESWGLEKGEEARTLLKLMEMRKVRYRSNSI